MGSKDGEQRIKDVLWHAGIPLEIAVAQVCRSFCGKHSTELPRITTLRAVYNYMRPNRAAREVDQSVQFDGY